MTGYLETVQSVLECIVLIYLVMLKGSIQNSIYTEEGQVARHHHKKNSECARYDTKLHLLVKLLLITPMSTLIQSGSLC